jgi:soluble lytic murein transglycosylase
MLRNARAHRLTRWVLSVFLSSLVAFCVGTLLLLSQYPLGYVHEIRASSALYRLDPAVTAALIRNESRFHPDALSQAGAVGLMQVMPETGAWIAERISLDTYSPEHLADPALNILLGTWYLRYLLDRFEYLEVALMAYNAGPSNAARWEGQLDRAFSETRTYVRRVQRSIPVYRMYLAAPWWFARLSSFLPRH